MHDIIITLLLYIFFSTSFELFYIGLNLQKIILEKLPLLKKVVIIIYPKLYLLRLKYDIDPLYKIMYFFIFGIAFLLYIYITIYVIFCL